MPSILARNARRPLHPTGCCPIIHPGRRGTRRGDRMLRHSLHLHRVVSAAALLTLLLVTNASAEQSHGPARLEPLGHNDLGGPQGGGKGGEGIALMVSHHKRYLFTAAESGPNCFSVVDVTDPSALHLVKPVDV